MNKRGSAFAWVLMVSMVLAVITLYLSGVAMSYHNQEISNIERDQAYITAKSGAELIANEIVNNTPNGDKIMNIIPDGTISDLHFEQKMGDCKITFTKPGEKDIGIISTATVGKESQTVKLMIHDNGFTPTYEKDLNKFFPAIFKPKGYTWPEWKTPERPLKPLKEEGPGDIAYKIIGTPDDKDSFYYVGADTDYNNARYKYSGLMAQGTGNIYIFVESGTTMYIGPIEGSYDLWIDGAGINFNAYPSIYIILEDGAGLKLGESVFVKSHVYVYSPFPGNKVDIFANKYADLEYRGSIMVNNTSDPEAIKNKEFPKLPKDTKYSSVYVPPHKAIYDDGSGGGGPAIPLWEVKSYEKVQ